LTRLLFPEAFGLVAIVLTVSIGIALLTDVGVSQAIIVSKSGGDRDYINTAWTIQVVQSICISMILIIISAPVSSHYKDPDIQWLLIITSLSALVSGLASTKPIVARRNITHAKNIYFISLGVQIIGIFFTVVLAYFNPAAVSLVWGGLITTCLTTAASHFLYPGPRNIFFINGSSAKHIFSFGGLVMLSSGLTFLTGEGAKLIYASFLGMGTIGLIGLAGGISSMANQLSSAVASKALFPALAELSRYDDRVRLRGAIEKAKTLILIPGWIFSLSLIWLGPFIIKLLYDERYYGAGLILQVMGMFGMASALTGSYAGILTAIGRPGLNLYILIAKAFLHLGSMWIGYRVFGGIGILAMPVVGAFLLYPVTAVIFHKLGLWCARIDLPIFLISTFVCLWQAPKFDWAAAASW
jgi:O-antigen/teichoic acid export membrane protein